MKYNITQTLDAMGKLLGSDGSSTGPAMLGIAYAIVYAVDTWKEIADRQMKVVERSAELQEKAQDMLNKANAEPCTACGADNLDEKYGGHWPDCPNKD
jgi:hypothetical protein